MADYPTLRRGSTGTDVVILQKILGVDPDGNFGPKTEQAVKDFQTSHGLEADGVVGPKTWAMLLQPTSREQQIIQIAINSGLMQYTWASRGTAPPGYIKGVALCFDRSLLRLRKGGEIGLEMAKAETNDYASDALAWANSSFNPLGMANDIPGEHVLRHLYIMILALGMRESSGRYCEGRDTSARNTTSDSAEAGAWQMSWDIHPHVPLLPKLFAEYSSTVAPNGYRYIFAQGVSCSEANWYNYGSGTGKAFQALCKNSPAFACEAVGLGLRRRRTHWGPVNRREVELKVKPCTMADNMFKAIQELPYAEVA